MELIGLVATVVTLLIASASLLLQLKSGREEQQVFFSVNCGVCIGEERNGWQTRRIDEVVTAKSSVRVIGAFFPGVVVWSTPDDRFKNLGAIPSVLAPGVTYSVVGESENWGKAWVLLILVPPGARRGVAYWQEVSSFDVKPELSLEECPPPKWFERFVPWRWRQILPVAPGGRLRMRIPKGKSVEALETILKIAKAQMRPSRRVLKSLRVQPEGIDAQLAEPEESL
uniref:hypothetical protein n=1 Tax=Vaginimicrobium propionicum TaxID=1871034 RepID=UPI00097077E0|nr:hypothetical protein [Vaginimicrobium propionicum]